MGCSVHFTESTSETSKIWLLKLSIAPEHASIIHFSANSLNIRNFSENFYNINGKVAIFDNVRTVGLF